MKRTPIRFDDAQHVGIDYDAWIAELVRKMEEQEKEVDAWIANLIRQEDDILRKWEELDRGDRYSEPTSAGCAPKVRGQTDFSCQMRSLRRRPSKWHLTENPQVKRQYETNTQRRPKWQFK